MPISRRMLRGYLPAELFHRLPLEKSGGISPNQRPFLRYIIRQVHHCLGISAGKYPLNIRLEIGIYQHTGKQEREEPRRSVTTVVLTESGQLLPVRTDKPVPKEMVFDVIQFCKQQIIASECQLSDVHFENVLATGADIIACTAHICHKSTFFPQPFLAF
mgnify:CR=1 FL=1